MNTNKKKEKSLRSQIREMEIGQVNTYPVRRAAYVRVLASYANDDLRQEYTTRVDWDKAIVEIKREA